ncbi:hypothetical protein QFZ75_007904 [Streptomyces sp. V3I8]|uniref:hypothetical protein n=1 Tax=Streptomyces sp. V3I8 TaxID=3042279 RepID=UPI0027872EAA|nr:hypothetical protein [Streptomyces sp. V3I8]MDQ1041402.1 hypothetical protein [Streptomyces sp. V3I8]
MLQQRHLSKVQDLGLQLLILLDGWAASDAKAKQRNEQLRLALVAAGMSPEDVYEDQDVETDPAKYDAYDEADDDYSAVDWTESASPDDWALLQQQLDSTRVSVEGSAGAEESAPDLPDVDFDREWQ